MGLGIKGSVGSKNEDYDESESLTKIFLGHTDGVTDTQNSGSTNTNKGTVSNSAHNTGSTNTTTQGPSTSTTHNSGRIDTSQLMLTEAAVQHIANGMLESNQGLAATVKGDNISGGYNSTTKGLLASDLISRISGEVAARGAQTVNTIGASSSSTTNSGSTTTQVIGASDTFSLQDTDMTQIMGPSSTKAITSSDTQTDQHDLKETSGSKDTVETKAETESKWILCTELVRQNRMPLKYYRYGSREFASYDEQSKKGYYFWAVPMLAHLKKHPYSNTSRIVCALLNARAEYIAAEGGCKGARKTILGWGTKQMYWGCWLLSRTVARNYGNVNISGGYYANEIK